jgi:Undecaprenyl-phosphate galactose phosphotransferase WbaP
MSNVTTNLPHAEPRTGPAPTPFRSAPPGDSSLTIDEIKLLHTAERPNRRLQLAYARQTFVTGFPLLALDIATTLSLLSGVAYVVTEYFGVPLTPSLWNQLAAILLLMPLLFSIHQLYPAVGTSEVHELRGVVRSTWLSFSALATVNALFGDLLKFEFYIFFGSAVIISSVLPIMRFRLREILSRQHWWGIRAVIIGSPELGLEAYKKLIANPTWGYRPLGYVSEASDYWKEERHDIEYLGTICDASSIAVANDAPVAIVASGDGHRGFVDRLAFRFPSVVTIGVILSSAWMGKREDESFHGISRINKPLLQFTPCTIKRCLDLLICIPALIALAIPIFAIGLLIKLKSPGPIFFGHRRIGQHGTVFRAWKFRTMVVDSEAVLEEYLRTKPEARAEWLQDQKLKNDPRIIGWVGHLLRKWSLDELPQLWNVLLGQMSLVGPRPIVNSEIEKYAEAYFCYSNMVPGITGLWQISGRNNTTYEERVTLDEHYARHWSPWLDLWILIKTPRVVLSRDGAY